MIPHCEPPTRIRIVTAMRLMAIGAALTPFPEAVSGQPCPNWYERHPSAAPSRRGLFAVAYDSFRERLVITGGHTRQPYDDGSFKGGTWEFDGTTWTKPDAPGERRRQGSAMAFDSRRNVCVLFGGYSGLLGPPTAETLEWDGMEWTLRSPPQSPPARDVHGMAYDSRRGVTVLFGGETLDGGNPRQLDDTWEWDGNTWTQRNVPGPSARTFPAMAFDRTRGVTVLFGGNPGDELARTQTWEWNGSSWSLRSTTFPITASSYGSMAYDEARQDLLLFTGSFRYAPLTGEAEAAVYSTWAWDGSTWTLRDQYEIPLSSSGEHYEDGSLAYDSARGIVIRLGGFEYASNEPLRMWEWPGDHGPVITQQPVDTTVSNCEIAFFSVEAEGDSSLEYQWRAGGIDAQEFGPDIIRGARSPTLSIDAATQLTGVHENVFDVVAFDDCGSTVSQPASWEVRPRVYWVNVTSQHTAMPSARKGHAMAYDSTRGRTVLFGGNANGFHNRETWEYDGVNWNAVALSGPVPRSGHGLSYGPIDGQGNMGIVLFGGRDNNAFHRDTWVWDGHTWRNIIAAATPEYRAGHAMAYDPTTDRVVMFGGWWSETGYFNDTWEWDGTNWHAVNAGTNYAPTPRDQHVMVYNPLRGRVMLYGGWKEDTCTYYNETWEWYGELDRWVVLDGSGPGNSVRPAIAFDGARNELRMFGGYGYDGRIFLENPWTYAWHEPTQTWQATDVVCPEARDEAAMVYDERNEFIVLFGGWNRSIPFERPLYPGTWHYQDQRPEVRERTQEGSARACDTIRLGVDVYIPPEVGTEYFWRKDTTFLSPDAPRVSGIDTDTLTIGPLRPQDSGTYDVHIESLGASHPSYGICSVLSDPVDLRVIPPHIDRVDVSANPGLGQAEVCSLASLTAQVSGVPEFYYQWMKGGNDLADGTRVMGSTTQTLQLGPLLFSQSGMDYAVRSGNGCAPADNIPTSGFEVIPKPWTSVASTGPGARWGQAMAYDSRRGVTVMFGGIQSGESRYGDTWEWNGNTWLLRATTGPSPRGGAAMAYDSDRGVCVLFGGRVGGSEWDPVAYRSDTWEWDGRTWTQRMTASGPSPRAASMIYDSLTHRTILHGVWGVPDGGGLWYLHDTWEYDGGSGIWTQVSLDLPDAAPGNYNAPGILGFDRDRSRRVLFNGWYFPGDIVASHLRTFEWDGAQWVRVFPADDPRYQPGQPGSICCGNPGLLTAGGGIAYHGGRHMLILNNGRVPFNDGLRWTWGYDGMSWHLLSANDGPPTSLGGNIAFDSARSSIVQFGGATPTGFVAPITWELVDADQVAIVRQPLPAGVENGQTATFSVIARGAPILTYQWRRNGVNLANGPRLMGATNGILNLSNVNLADAGRYDVVVSNDCGSVTSAAVRLSVPVTIFGDGDLDGDVDLQDYPFMQACELGPSVPLREGCEPFDFDGDGDGDVDLRDVAAFQVAFLRP